MQHTDICRGKSNGRVNSSLEKEKNAIRLFLGRNSTVRALIFVFREKRR